ncbi:hypothetical protein [Effusibacillus dendaii]|uniref:Ferric oxidoreductase domain-containing protein n=1 Tax=Effusibacillus dendaii TaxID=2743772 RepID=A0A7I8DBY7_9BACL|nr:hypothetical protein [Effusibacillus dendaii]BCJ86030.1 hypothetical protein skT53_10150 [Effusibacillus dendaii]
MNTDWLNAWNLTHSAGTVSYLLLSLSVVTGLYAQIIRGGKPTAAWLFPLHETLGYWGFYLGLFHGLILWRDGRSCIC